MTNPKNPLLATVSLLLFSAGLFPSTQAATLNFSSTAVFESSSNSFEQIQQEFAVGNLLSIDSLSDESFSINLASETLRKSLEMTVALNKADPISRSALTFEGVVNSLKRLEITSDKNQQLTVTTLPQVGFSDVYEGVYEFANLYGRRKPFEGLVGDYLAFDPRSVAPTELPKNYFYNRNSVSIGVAKAIFQGTPNATSVDGYVDEATDIIAFPNVREGLQLNRVKPEEEQLDSTLQLWPRNPLSLEVTSYDVNSQEKLQQLEQFGTLEPSVNFRLIPRDILANQLDLEVDWVNEGEYSSNLRKNVEAITEQNRASQVAFQNRVETRQSERFIQQQDYQREIQERMSQGFQKASERQNIKSVPGLSRYASKPPSVNLTTTPQNKPVLPSTVPSARNFNAFASPNPTVTPTVSPVPKPVSGYSPTLPNTQTNNSSFSKKPSPPTLPNSGLTQPKRTNSY